MDGSRLGSWCQIHTHIAEAKVKVRQGGTKNGKYFYFNTPLGYGQGYEKN